MHFQVFRRVLVAQSNRFLPILDQYHFTIIPPSGFRGSPVWLAETLNV